jgi:uncharacterized metal-binding protein YceD (DUF177 family)
MLFRLDEIDQHQKVDKAITMDRREIRANAGPTVLTDVTAALQLSRRSKRSHEVAYRVTAHAEMGCVRCGEALTINVAESGSLAVTDQQPEESHVILSGGEMETRFLADPELDLEHLVLEICELSLPDYPKHENGCGSTLADAERDETEVASSSPFQVLSQYLER